MSQDKIRTYSELIKLGSFEERFEYLKLAGKVCQETFGFDRYLNQTFYKDKHWQRIRRDIILRDGGFDLAFRHPDYEILDNIYVHHMNPITSEDIVERTDYLLNPEFLVCVSYKTHQAIHYSDFDLARKVAIERVPFDTCPWKNAEKGEHSQ